MPDATAWPELPLSRWQDTYATFHMWTQVIGKIRLAATPLVNHWWNVPLHPTARGLTTGLMFRGPVAFEMHLDLLDHRLDVTTSEGPFGSLPLVAQPVSRFHAAVVKMLRDLAIDVPIWTTPVEVPDPIPFERDEVHASYDPAWVERWFRAILATTKVLGEFRARFLGKASPVHFFWGSFDLAFTLFSGRRAPERPGADRVTREAYSHEVISFGFWPGGNGVDDAAFYAYAAPEPPGFAEARLRPDAASWHPRLREFLLPYEVVRRDADPAARLLEFVESAYEAGAELAGWDRASLEREHAPRERAWAPDPLAPPPMH
jgi:hypothetical protein